MKQHCCIDDGDGDTITVETVQAYVSPACAFIKVWCCSVDLENIVALERNQLLELKKAVDAAYKEIDK